MPILPVSILLLSITIPNITAENDSISPPCSQSRAYFNFRTDLVDLLLLAICALYNNWKTASGCSPPIYIHVGVVGCVLSHWFKCYNNNVYYMTRGMSAWFAPPLAISFRNIGCPNNWSLLILLLAYEETRRICIISNTKLNYITKIYYMYFEWLPSLFCRCAIPLFEIILNHYLPIFISKVDQKCNGPRG